MAKSEILSKIQLYVRDLPLIEATAGQVMDGVESIYVCFHCFAKRGVTLLVISLQVFENRTFEILGSHPCTKKMDPKGYLEAISRAYDLVSNFFLRAKT